MITIQAKRVKYPEGGKKIIQQSIFLTLKEVGNSEKNSVTVMLVDNEFQQSLNRDFRSIDKPTDVLSFPSGELLPDGEGLYLGDIVISLPIAVQQALDAAHPLGNELALLSIHGTLHLLGFDHDTPIAKREMWELQTRILMKMGIEMERCSGDADE